MSRKQALHMDLIGAISDYEKNRTLSLDELAEFSNTKLKKYLHRNKGKRLPSYEAVQNYKANL